MKSSFLVLLTSIFTINAFSQARIVGGSNVTPGQYEFLAGLSYSVDPAEQFCGGSLIAPEWVLTAGHCTEGMTAAEMIAFFKVYYLTHPVAGFSIDSVETIYLHPNFDNVSLDNDMALLKLKTPVNNITPVRLPSKNDTTLIAVGKVNTCIGYGSLDNNGNYPDTLQKVNLPIVASNVCNGANSYDGEITINMLCAGFMAGGKDACSGDSGGPLFVNENGTMVQTGIVSWGDDCGVANFPGVYTKVSNYIDWIEDITGLSFTPTGITVVREGCSPIFAYSASSASISINACRGNLHESTLIDMSGRVLARTVSDINIHVLNATNLPAGIYLVSTRTDNGNITRKIKI